MGKKITLGESPGLVGTDIGDGAQGFQTVELSHDNVPVGHSSRAAGEGDSEDDLPRSKLASMGYEVKLRIKHTTREAGTAQELERVSTPDSHALRCE